MVAEHAKVIDGKLYLPGDEIIDIGKWECIEANDMKRSYQGISSEVDKLPTYVETGSTAMCLDTGDYYIFHKGLGKWYLQ